MENTATAKEPINSDMLISEIISKYPDAVYLLMNCGMGCVSCPASQMETIEEAAAVHGVNVDELVKALNDKISG